MKTNFTYILLVLSTFCWSQHPFQWLDRPLTLEDNPPSQSVIVTPDANEIEHRIILSLSDDWEQDSNFWFKFDSVTYVYDVEGLLIEQYEYRRDSNQWMQHSRSFYTYNNEALLINTYREIWKDTFWRESVNLNFEYDDLGNLAVRELKFWNVGINGWKNNQKIFYTYDDENQLTFEYWEKGENNTDWKQSTNVFYEYTDGKQSKKFVRFWRDNLMDYENAWEETSEYAPDGSQTVHKFFTWENEMWVHTEIDTENFDANQNMVLRVLQRVSDLTGQMENTFRYVNEYDVNNNHIMEETNDWDPVNETWLKRSITVWTFNEFDLPTEEFYKYWDEDNLEWVNGYREFYFYESFTDFESIPFEKLGMQLFPNPTSGIINIQLENQLHITTTIYIINIHSQVVFNQELEPSDFYSVDASSFPNGLYLVLIRHENQHYVQKLNISH